MADRQSSAAVRILKAKLKLLKRPTVWGAGIVLFLPLLFLADYWLNPQQFWVDSFSPNRNLVLNWLRRTLPRSAIQKTGHPIPVAY